MVDCEILPMKEYPNSQSQKVRYGKYHGSNFWDVKGFGRKKWVVALRMRVVLDDHLRDISERELINSCIEKLNTPPPRKKYAKKKPQPKYGKLELYSAKRSHTSTLSTISERLYSVLVIVDKNKSKMFWGKGQNV